MKRKRSAGLTDLCQDALVDMVEKEEGREVAKRLRQAPLSPAVLNLVSLFVQTTDKPQLIESKNVTLTKYQLPLPDVLDELRIGEQECPLISDYSEGLVQFTASILERCKKVIIQNCTKAWKSTTKETSFLAAVAAEFFLGTPIRVLEIRESTECIDATEWKTFLESCSRALETLILDVPYKCWTSQDSLLPELFREGLNSSLTRRLQRVTIRHVPAQVANLLRESKWRPIDLETHWESEEDKTWTLIAEAGKLDISSASGQRWPMFYLHPQLEKKSQNNDLLPLEIQSWMQILGMQYPHHILQPFYSQQYKNKDKTWTTEVQKAINWYTNSGFQTVWDYLDDDFQKTKDWLEGVRRVVEPVLNMFETDVSAYLPAGTILFEGQGRYEKDLVELDLKVGDVITRTRVTSTAWHVLPALTFAIPSFMGKWGHERLLCVHRIRRHEDVRGIAVEFRPGPHALEREIMLTHHLQLTVTRMERRYLYEFQPTAGHASWENRDLQKGERPEAFRVVYFDVERARPITRAWQQLDQEWKQAMATKDKMLAWSSLERAQKAMERAWRNPQEKEVLQQLEERVREYARQLSDGN